MGAIPWKGGGGSGGKNLKHLWYFGKKFQVSIFFFHIESFEKVFSFKVLLHFSFEWNMKVHEVKVKFIVVIEEIKMGL